MPSRHPQKFVVNSVLTPQRPLFSWKLRIHWPHWVKETFDGVGDALGVCWVHLVSVWILRCYCELLGSLNHAACTSQHLRTCLCDGLLCFPCLQTINKKKLKFSKFIPDAQYISIVQSRMNMENLCMLEFSVIIPSGKNTANLNTNQWHGMKTQPQSHDRVPYMVHKSTATKHSCLIHTLFWSWFCDEKSLEANGERTGEIQSNLVQPDRCNYNERKQKLYMYLIAIGMKTNVGVKQSPHQPEIFVQFLVFTWSELNLLPILWKLSRLFLSVSSSGKL